jgi:hypothetical protein
VLSAGLRDGCDDVVPLALGYWQAETTQRKGAAAERPRFPANDLNSRKTYFDFF